MNFPEARARLVGRLKEEGFIKSPNVEKAMLTVPREAFLPSYLRLYAYEDSPLRIMYGQTISAPHMVALMCELLDLRPNIRVMEIGTGTGYHAAVCAEAMGLSGEVYTIEYYPGLALYATQNLARLGYLGIVRVHVGDGSLGLPRHAPFHRILVTAAAPRIPPRLIEQLSDGGIMVIPLEEGDVQVLYRVTKVGSRIERRAVTYVSFVRMKLSE